MNLREKLEQLTDEIEKRYHRAPRAFDLPYDGAVYSANAKDGKYYSVPYHPHEVAEYVRSRIDQLVGEEDGSTTD